MWLELDQHELDEAYDQSVYAFNQRHVQDRRDERNALMAKVLGKPERVAYGSAEIEKVDIYKTKRPGAPTMIFLHGGAWRGGRSAQGAYHAEPFVKAGANFINVEFDNVPETNGDFTPDGRPVPARGGVGLWQRKKLWRRSQCALSLGLLVRQSPRRLRGDHRVGEAGAAARYPQGRACSAAACTT